MFIPETIEVDPFTGGFYCNDDEKCRIINDLVQENRDNGRTVTSVTFTEDGYDYVVE